MLREMRPSELGMWAGVFAVDPWGEERADLRAGIVAASIANFSGRARQAKAPIDFMPFAKKPTKGGSLSKDLMSFLKSRPKKAK